MASIGRPLIGDVLYGLEVHFGFGARGFGCEFMQDPGRRLVLD